MTTPPSTETVSCPIVLPLLPYDVVLAGAGPTYTPEELAMLLAYGETIVASLGPEKNR